MTSVEQTNVNKVINSRLKIEITLKFFVPSVDFENRDLLID